MSTENSLGKLRPGAWKMVHALIEGPKTFSEIRDATGLSNTAIANYLKELADLFVRDRETKEYRLFWIPPSDEGDYAIWESTDLKDVQRAAQYVDTIMEAEIPNDLKFDRMVRFWESALGFLSGNILLNLSKATQREEVLDALADVRRLMDEYVTPFIGFLAMYCYKQGAEIAEWLELIGEEIIRNAKEEFDPEKIAELAEEGQPRDP